MIHQNHTVPDGLTFVKAAQYEAPPNRSFADSVLDMERQMTIDTYTQMYAAVFRQEEGKFIVTGDVYTG